MRGQAYSLPMLEEIESAAPSLGSLLMGLNADVLKKMARVWVGKEAYKLNKEKSIKVLAQSFQDPVAVREMVKSLTDSDRASLGLIKLRGGRVAYLEEFAGELLMLSDQTGSKRRSYGWSNDKHYNSLSDLVERGLMFRIGGRSRWEAIYHPSPAVYVPGEVLTHVEPAPPQELELTPVSHRTADFVKRTSEVLLRSMAFAQALKRVGEIQITNKGARSGQSATKLRKVLGWKEEEERSPTPLSAPVEFMIALWYSAGLLRFDRAGRSLLPDESKIGAILDQPLEAQARVWAPAYRSICHWFEYIPPSIYFSERDATGHTKFNTLRGALLMAIAALPDSQAWYRIKDLIDVMNKRIGEYFSLGYRHQFYVPYDTPKEKAVELRAKWDQEQQNRWRGTEGVWIGGAIVGPLFQLGFVELAFESDEKTQYPNLFRLTEIGQSALYDIYRPAATVDPADNHLKQTAETRSCWVVQPNFDVIVYLDDATPRQLNFIESIGERRQLGDAAATYRLTREAAYNALESGIAAGEMIRSLQVGSRHPVPENVVRSLSDWAQRRDRLAVRLNAQVVEFHDSEAREAALAERRVKGAPIGDRFVLVSGADKISAASVIPYLPSPPRCLTVHESGKVEIAPDRGDLIIAGELSAYCEPGANEYSWRITRASVEKALARGWTPAQIEQALIRRAQHDPPPILLWSIRAWSGGRTAPQPPALPTTPILLFRDSKLADAIAGSKIFRGYLISRLGATSFLVWPDKAEALRAKLAEYGFVADSDLLATGYEPMEEK